MREPRAQGSWGRTVRGGGCHISCSLGLFRLLLPHIPGVHGEGRLLEHSQVPPGFPNCPAVHLSAPSPKIPRPRWHSPSQHPH